MKKIKLDKEEQDILDSFERGEWKPVKNMKREIRRLQSDARAMLRKTSRVNIRIPPQDLEGMQRKALEEGIPLPDADGERHPQIRLGQAGRRKKALIGG